MSTLEYGKRLMPQVLQDEAAHDPQRLFAKSPRSANLLDGFRAVTFEEMNRAVDSLVHSLLMKIGCPRKQGETVAFLGLPDIRYNIVFYACVKIGFKVFLPSPRNPPAINLSLMRQIECSTVLFTAEVKATIDDLHLLENELRCVQVDALEVLLRPELHCSPVLYDRTFNDARDEPILVLHSSGSTGIPKTVTMTHGTFAAFDNDRNFPSVSGRRNHDLTIWDFDGQDAQIYEPFPPFHLAGFMNKIMVPLWTKTVPIFGPASRPPSGGLVADIMRHQKIRGALLPPIIAEQLYHEQDGLEVLKKLDVLCFAGGPLAEAVGNELVKHTVLCQFYGSTEVGQVRQLVPHREDWSYMEFHPDTKLEMRPVDDAYELVILADAGTADFSALNHNFPQLTSWETKDLFKPHPTKPGLWRFHARRDDIIVLSSGEKFNPVPLEGRVSVALGISGAIAVGQGRPYPILLVELKQGFEPVQSTLDELWSDIEEANRLSPSYARMSRSSVMFSSPGRPFIRAGKGTIIRSLTADLYADDIEAVYQNQNQSFISLSLKLQGEVYTEPVVRDFLRLVARQVINSLDLQDEDDFYTSGLDSRSTMEMATLIREAIIERRPGSHLSWLSIDIFYNNPTISELSKVILDFLIDGVLPRNRDRISQLRSSVDLHVSRIPGRGPKLVDDSIDSFGLCIAVTGTTGYLGTHLLLSLLVHPKVSKLYCLNRSERAEAVWQESIRNGDGMKLHKKPVFLQVEFLDETLGLTSNQLSDLVADCDLIIHNAWSVNFNLPLRSFNNNLEGLCSLINVSLRSPRRPRICFVSSIAATGIWSDSIDSSLEVPEAHVSDLQQALATGYGESKLVAEHILHSASTTSYLPVSILRVGQVAPRIGHDKAQWPEHDAVPILLKTSREIGLIPSDLSDINWIPVDKVASIISEIAIHNLITESQPRLSYYNIVNHKPVTWSEMIPVIKDWCSDTSAVGPFSLWIKRLREHLSKQGCESHPANSLLPFFKLVEDRGTWSTWDTGETYKASQTFRDLQPIDADGIRSWLQNLISD